MPGNAGWGGRVRTSAWRNQNPLPYHLATSQSAPPLNGVSAGFQAAMKVSQRSPNLAPKRRRKRAGNGSVEPGLAQPVTARYGPSSAHIISWSEALIAAAKTCAKLFFDGTDRRLSAGDRATAMAVVDQRAGNRAHRRSRFRRMPSPSDIRSPMRVSMPLTPFVLPISTSLPELAKPCVSMASLKPLIGRGEHGMRTLIRASAVRY